MLVKSAEDIKKDPKLFAECREYFSPDGMRRQIVEHRERRERAEATAATLREQIKLTGVKREAVLYESRVSRARQLLRHPEKVIGREVRLLSDEEVSKAYNRLIR